MTKVKNFFKSAGRYLISILPAFLFFTTLLFSFSMPVFATSGGFVTDKNPTSGTVYNGDYTKFYSQSKALEQFEYDGKIFMHLYEYLCAYSVLYSIPDLNSASPIVSDFLVALAHYFQCTDSLNPPLVVQPLPLSGLRLVSYDHSKDTIHNGELCNLFEHLKPVNIEGSYLCYLRNDIFYFLLEDDDIFMVTPDCMGGFLSSGDFIIAGSAFNEAVQTNNVLYFPKNTTGIMSYRTDERYHNICDSMDHLYYQMDFYAGSFGFSPVGGGNEIYLVLFYKTDTDSYYSKMQLHFVLTSEEVWAEDRDEIDHYAYTLTCEYWDMVDGSKETSTTVTVFENLQYNYFELMWNSSGRITIQYFNDYTSYSNIFSPLSYKDFLVTDLDLFYKTDLSSSIKFGSSTNLQRHFTKSLAVHDSSCSFGGQCDIGYIASATPLSLIYDIDTTKIPENYYITVSGDTIYDYSITNPETGQKDTIQNFITNNYTFNNGDTNIDTGDHNTSIGGSGSGNGGGGGDVNVNVTVNNNIGGGGGGSYDMPDTSFFDDYLDDALEESTGIRKFIKDFFNSVPGEITKLICTGLVLAILCRLIGR